MKLTNLNQPIKDFSGNTVVVPGDAPAFTIKTVLENCLGSGQRENAKAYMDDWDTGRLIGQSKEQCELRAEQFLSVQNAVERNGYGYQAIIIGQVLAYLREQDGPPMENPPGSE